MKEFFDMYTMDGIVDEISREDNDGKEATNLRMNMKIK